MLEAASSGDQGPAFEAREADGGEGTLYAAIGASRGDEDSIKIAQDFFRAALQAPGGDPFRIHLDAERVRRMTERGVDGVVRFVSGIEIADDGDAGAAHASATPAGAPHSA